MSNEFIVENRIPYDEKDQIKPIVNIKWATLSERAISKIRTIFRKIRSEIEIESNINYDDLCGPWVYSKNPLYSQYVDLPHPNLCIWKYFTEEDILYLKKHQENKDIIRSFFENKLLSETTGKNNTILINILCEFFKLSRLHLFSEKNISACLGIVYLTHLFFLSYPWCTVQEVYLFFYKTILLHVVSYPTKGLEIFNIIECKHLFNLFHKVYMENIVLLHVLCHTNYHFTVKLHIPED